MRNQTLNLFLQISKHRVIDNYLPKIRQCLAVVDTEQLWAHEAHEANSVGGILLHICEQLICHTAAYKQTGLVSAASIDDYFPDMMISPGELLDRVEQAFADWTVAMDEFLKDANSVDFFSIYHLVEHTSYHLGQIVDRVQRKTGASFQFVQNGLNEAALRQVIENLNSPTTLS